MASGTGRNTFSRIHSRLEVVPPRLSLLDFRWRYFLCFLNESVEQNDEPVLRLVIKNTVSKSVKVTLEPAQLPVDLLAVR